MNFLNYSKKTFAFQKHQIKVEVFVTLNSDEYFVEYDGNNIQLNIFRNF
jgi:hypothetical protein